MWDVRAEEAARSVLAIFGSRARGIPRTRIGVVERPGRPRGAWHYWWQAHLIDCLVDARLRGSTLVTAAQVRRHVRGVWLRNGLRLTNDFYDDMAWFALAAQRAGRLAARALPLPRDPASRLRPVLERALDNPFGGAWWTTQRTYLNAAATGPIACFLARCGETDEARRLLEWMREFLADRDGLLRDGVRIVDGAVAETVGSVFSYNQGPVLGVLLELGGTELAAAEAHVMAVARRLTRPGTDVLATHGGGDGGLFTGILTRYLALAAADPRLGAEARTTAARVVLATAEDLWSGRAQRGWRGRGVSVFPRDTIGSSARFESASSSVVGAGASVASDGAGASVAGDGAGGSVARDGAGGSVVDDGAGASAVRDGAGASVPERAELSWQLQAWMSFEAAHVCSLANPANPSA